MKKQEKIAKFMEKGLTKEEAEKLIKYGQDNYLSIEELKIKYDNPLMDTEFCYPNWLSEEELMKMCFQTVKDKYGKLKLNWCMEPEELANELFVWARLRMSWFKDQNHQYLKTALSNICMNIARDKLKKATYINSDKSDDEYVHRGKTYCVSINAKVNNIKFNDGRTYEDILYFDNEMSETELEIVQSIRKLKNKRIKDLLIVSGYLLAKIDGLKKDYYDLLDELDETTYNNIIDVMNKVYKNEDIVNFKKSVGTKNKSKRVIDVTVKDIVKAFGTDYFSSADQNKCTVAQIIECLKDYTQYFVCSES